MQLAPLQGTDSIALALHRANVDWPWARLVLHLDHVAHRFEAILKLVYLEHYLRNKDLANQAVEEARLDIY